MVSPLGESRRASFNEKLISRVSRRRRRACLSERAGSFLLLVLGYRPAVSRTLRRVFIQPPFPALSLSLSPSFCSLSAHPFLLREMRDSAPRSFSHCLPPALLLATLPRSSTDLLFGVSSRCSSRVFIADGSYARLHPPLFS